jgi:hypothetical protein
VANAAKYIPLYERLQQKIAEVGTSDLAKRQVIDDLAEGRLSWTCQGSIDGTPYKNSLPPGCSWRTGFLGWQECTAAWGAVRIGPAPGIAAFGERKPIIAIEGIMVAAPVDGENVALKNLLEDVIREIPFPPPEDRRHGWKRKWKERAAGAINMRHKKEPEKVKETTPGSVGNRMSEFELWPA